jgi:hypothetical protein
MDERITVRFWAKVKRGGPDECWEWQGARRPFGYGRFGIAGKNVEAHRVSWQLANGPVRPGIKILHTCDNPSCVNPGHLFPGTQQDNIADMNAKGRARSGSGPDERAPNAVVTPQIVAEIRAAWGNRPTQAQLAERYGISQANVSQIVMRKTWTSVK